MIVWRGDKVIGSALPEANESRLRARLAMRFPGTGRPVIDLDVEDLWRRGHPDLVRLLKRRLERHLGAPQVPPLDAKAGPR